MLVLKDYQRRAVDELISNSFRLLKNNQNSRLIFKSPTGSGKTIMMAEFIKELTVNNYTNKELSFIWAAPRSLHNQSKEKLTEYFDKNFTIVCSNFNELKDNKIAANEILFLNWESINQDNNLIVKENEKNNYLDKVLENTHEEGRLIILIIDESHHHAGTQTSQGLISEFNPVLTICVSATAEAVNPDAIVNIYLDEVKNEGMIKKSIILNEGFNAKLSEDNIKHIFKDGSDEAILDRALKKRSLIKKEYKKKGIKINPLLLIQLPDEKKHEAEFKDEIIDLLKEKNITFDNGKLGIWLSSSKDKKNLNNIEKSDSDVEVLIFKQAIALGWDCPRAHALLLFRHWKSQSFSIQTLGRIMRVPDPKTGHYENDILDNGYIFTNLNQVSIEQDIAAEYIQLFSSKRRKDTNLNIDSVHRIRMREKTRFNIDFISIFLKAAKDYNLDNLISLKKQEVDIDIIEEKKIDNLDNTDLFEDIFSVSIDNEQEIQKIFDRYIIQNLSPFFPEQRSIDRLKKAIYLFFDRELNISLEEDFLKIINLVLGKENHNHFSNVIDISKEIYREKVSKREEVLELINGWDIPNSLIFSTEVKEMPFKKSVMQPFYSKSMPKTELNFIKFIDKSNKIDWWFKNGDSDKTFFAVEYLQDDKKKLFYVDFIIQLKDGRLGFFDTKSGFTIMESKDKVDGLRKFLSKDTLFFGGIATNTDNVNFKGIWKFFDKKGSDLKEGIFENWELLDL